MIKKKKLLAIGEILWDVFPNTKRLGGAVTNVAFIAKQLGIDAKIVSAIGKDPEGHEILDSLIKSGLSTKHINITNDFATGWVDVTLDHDGKPDYVIHENVAWDYIFPNSKLFEEAKDADAICFGSLAQRNIISHQNIQKILSTQKEEGLRVFDINLRLKFYNRKIITDSLNQCNVLKLNDEELPVLKKLFGFTGDDKKTIRNLMEKFEIRIVAYTQGSQGASLFDTSLCYSVPAHEIEIIDTVGAGDSFTAVLISGLLNNQGLQEIVEQANNIAAFVCQKAGGTVILPDTFINYSPPAQ